MQLAQGNSIIRDISIWESPYIRWSSDDCEDWEIILAGYEKDGLNYKSRIDYDRF